MGLWWCAWDYGGLHGTLVVCMGLWWSAGELWWCAWDSGGVHGTLVVCMGPPIRATDPLKPAAIPTLLFSTLQPYVFLCDQCYTVVGRLDDGTLLLDGRRA